MQDGPTSLLFMKSNLSRRANVMRVAHNAFVKALMKGINAAKKYLENYLSLFQASTMGFASALSPIDDNPYISIIVRKTL